MKHYKTTKPALTALMLAGVATLAGCGSLAAKNTLQTQERLVAKDGIVFGMAAKRGDVAYTCEVFARLSGKDVREVDPRCAPEEQGKYDAYLLGVANPHVNPFVDGDAVAVFVPKSAGYQYKFTDILKVRIDGFRPAEFIEFVSHDDKPNCYYGMSGMSWAGVICPKYGWNFREKLNLP